MGSEYIGNLVATNSSQNPAYERLQRGWRLRQTRVLFSTDFNVSKVSGCNISSVRDLEDSLLLIISEGDLRRERD